MTYYTKNYKEYILRTKDVDMTESYQLFLKHIDSKGRLLDIGFGSARDMLYFKTLGFDVFGIDSEQNFVLEALHKNLNVSCIDILDYKVKEEYDFVWANALLLHIHKDLLNEAFMNCSNILKNNGVMYCSFKYGEDEGIIDDRYYIYLTEHAINNYIRNTNLIVIDYKITIDKLNRSNKWINFVLKKHEM